MRGTEVCARCGTPLAPGTPACPRCGAAVSGGEGQRWRVDPKRRLCPGCGRVAPSQGASTCEACGHDLSRPIRDPGGDRGPVFVAVRAEVKCRSCGLHFPLEHLETDGEIRCERCGLLQAFDPAEQVAPLTFAHSVGDLAGPGPEGRYRHARVSLVDDNPYASVGLRRAVVPWPGAEPRFDVSPGHPVCDRCEVPLHVQIRAEGVAITCPRCQEQGRYPPLSRRAPRIPGLVAVLAEEDRGDRMEANVSGEGLISMTCPQCGGNLPAQSRGSQIRCPYCNAVSRIPVRHRGTEGERREPETWWVAFDGPSEQRRELEHSPPETGAKDSVDKAEELEPWLPLRLALALGIPGAVLAVTGVMVFLVERFIR